MLKFCITENLTHLMGHGIFAGQTKKLIAMKKFFLILVIALSIIPAHAQVKVKKLNPFLSTTTFNLPGQTPYVENALAFECKSVTYKQFQPGKFKATLEIVTAFRKGEETTFSKVLLDSPVVTDTANLDGAFVDQQRFPLANGEYEMEIIVTDKGSDRAPVRLTVTVEVDYPQSMPAVSDILLFDSYSKAAQPSACTKSGYDFVPRVFPFYSASADKLHFYAELYNSNKLYDEGKFLVSYYIETAESSSLMKERREIEFPALHRLPATVRKVLGLLGRCIIRHTHLPFLKSVEQEYTTISPRFQAACRMGRPCFSRRSVWAATAAHPRPRHLRCAEHRAGQQNRFNPLFHLVCSFHLLRPERIGTPTCRAWRTGKEANQWSWRPSPCHGTNGGTRSMPAPIRWRTAS